jgi:hypothetical protein
MKPATGTSTPTSRRSGLPTDSVLVGENTRCTPSVSNIYCIVRTICFPELHVPSRAMHASKAPCICTCYLPVHIVAMQ